MKITVYRSFPKDAWKIRKAVFIDEQGFYDEFDEVDEHAIHIVMYDEKEMPAATCRVFWNDKMDSYILGRLAVVKEYRGQHLGSIMLKEAEKYVREAGKKQLALHAQCRAAEFYKKSGFVEFGDVELEEGCPHVWMKKYV